MSTEQHTQNAQNSSGAIQLSVLNRQQQIAAGSMVVVAIAAFLPWVSVFGLSVAGIEGDGKLTLLAALAGLAALAFGTDVIGRRKLPQPAYVAVSGIAGAIVAIVAIADLNEFAAFGLYLTLFGGVAWAAALGWEFLAGRKAAAADAA
ncbi:hypothetical protein [Sporichthya polymorpha]|uniref:hypothetical protein n=1 Tax=Sporichthya polymorpha TaxID=35751 RepID=UPI00036387A3|nr:hypothetical protein [Sporichthya polymorpha]